MSSDPSSKPDSISFEYHVVALIDVLNQKQRLRELASIPRSPAEQSVFIEAVKDSVGTIDKIRLSFTSFYEAYAKQTPSTCMQLGLPNVPPALMEALNTRDAPRFQHFSDTVIIYEKVLDRHGKPSPRAICDFFGACASVMITALAFKLPVRGGVDVGVASECWEREIYGPALASAYHLENKVAQYPRIVLGGELLSYLRSFLEPRHDNPVALWNKRLSEICLDMIGVDEDGVPFLDYLGKGARNLFAAAAGGIASDIQNGLEFVTTEHERFVREGNQKLALRYGRLRRYWESRAKLWITP